MNVACSFFCELSRVLPRDLLHLVLTWTCEAASAQPKYNRKRAAAADAGASALSLKAELSKQHLISASASMRGSGIRRSNLALDKLRAS